MTMKKNGGRGRPKRQRTPTTLYSDDNPSTFTTKKKRNGSLEDLPSEEEISSPINAFDEHEQNDDSSSSPRRPSRRKKAYNRHSLVSTTFSQKERDAAAKEEDENDLPEVKPTPRPTGAGRKRRRPSDASSAPKPSLDESPSDHGPISSIDSPSPPQLSASPARTCTIIRRKPVSEGTFLSHAVKVMPILPAVISMNASSKMQQQYPRIFGNGLGKDSTLEKTDWTPLYSPNVYFEDDYNSDDNRELDPSILPVTRSITCISISKPDQEYMAVGDDAGFCIIYSLGTHIRPIARLETVACQQRSRDQQKRIREQIKNSKGKLRSLIKDTSETSILAIGMVGLRVVIATSCELECMDIPSQSSLWVCPLSVDRIVTSLDVHVETFDVLVSCDVAKSKNRGPSPMGQAPTSPLMLLQHSQSNIEICDANSPLLVKSPCCTAIWDTSETIEPRLLFVAVSNTDQELELVLVQGGSIDNWKVACKTRIPVKASNHQTRLCQSDKGTYTLVAGSRGIRLYQTETLQLLNTYGDQLALHGKSVVWQDCLLLNSRQFHKRLHSCSGGDQICDDWLATNDNSEDSDLGPYVVGIPNVKGPKELCEAIHVWKTDQSRTVPTLSLPLPAKAEGVNGVLNAPVMGQDRLVLATSDGFGHTLLPMIKSNFAGIMYPPGYNVITDNLEYIENEDELDFSNSWPSTKERKDDMELEELEEIDDDLREAMRQSLLDQVIQDTEDAEVNILDATSADVEFPVVVPCRPESYLRQEINKSKRDDSAGDSDEIYTEPTPGGNPVSNSAPLFIDKILSRMPNVYKKKELSEDGITVSVTKIIVATTNPAANRPGRGKRSRAGNLEAMLKSSINPRLQKYMISRENTWADGSGSMRSNDLEMEKSQSVVISPEVGTEDVEDAEVALNTETNGTENTVSVEVVQKATEENGFQRSKDGPKSSLTTLGGIRSDETAVALRLLGLSPCSSGAISPANTASEPASRCSPLNTGSAVTSDTASDTGARSYSLDLTFQTKRDPNCFACRGRHVLHTCGQRSLPIDYDQVAKAEREKKEKEEEAKKKVRAEKRRQADARRREARKVKQREIEERRIREEEAERLRNDELTVNQTAFARPQANTLISMEEQYHVPVIGAAEATPLQTYSQPQGLAAPTFEQPTAITPALGSRTQDEGSLIQSILQNVAGNGRASTFLQALQGQAHANLLNSVQAAAALQYSQAQAATRDLESRLSTSLSSRNPEGGLALLQVLQAQQSQTSPVASAPTFPQPENHTDSGSAQPATQNGTGNEGALSFLQSIQEQRQALQSMEDKSEAESAQTAPTSAFSQFATLAVEAGTPSNLATEARPGPTLIQSTARPPTNPAPAPSPRTSQISRKESTGTLVSADALVALANFASSSSSSDVAGNQETETQAPPATEDAKSKASHGFGAGVPSISETSKIPTFASLQSGGGSNSAAHPTAESNQVGAAASLHGNLQTGGFVWPPVSERYTGNY
ncbi:unnamed protein product [Cylindrotheca closterium]|uniref:Uncharacterized protein n=1 Tax=Cylindrotheca closterium TaxID=2856 RepID=A0AAD2JKH5_9STRA|nr:unnamed protein product [Cylindrotheca closterium]